MSKRVSTEDRDKALEHLRRVLKPGNTVYTILRHVSKSGMIRDISCYAIDADGPQWLDGWIASAGLFKRSFGDHDALRVSGCGMDMGFAIVYDLSRALFPGGFECIGEGDRQSYCPANDHSNGDRNYTPHQHRDGGYALRHKWM